MRSSLRAILRRSRMESEMNTELQFHLEARAEDLMRSGMHREEAMRRARIEFGGVDHVKQECREAYGFHFVEDLIADLRFSLRSLRKSAGFTAVAVLTLALGIGANTAIFTVVYGVLFRPLPFPEPDRIVELAELAQGEVGELDLTATQLQRLRELGGGFAHTAGLTDIGFNLATEGAAEHVRGTPVSADYFAVLGVHPAIGREFLPQEDHAEGQRVAILSQALWKSRFAAEPSAIGRKVLLNGDSYTVIGVMPAGFDPRAYSDINPGLPVDIWVPLALVSKTAGSGENIQVLARLKRGVTPAQLGAQMKLVTDEFRKEFPEDIGPKTRVTFLPYQFMLGADLRPYLLLLLGAVGFVLLIACANVANLLFARSRARGREIAVRIALGATRSRLYRQLLSESVAIALIGSALAWALAKASLGALLATVPFDLPRVHDIHLDLRIFAFTLLVSIFTGFLAGLAPALYTSRGDPNEMLKSREARATAGTDRASLRQALIIGEFALSLVLLTGAGLMIATFAKLISAGPGFSPRGVLTVQFWLTGSKYRSTPEMAAFYRAVEQRIRSLPGVETAGIVAAGLPLERGGHSSLRIAGPNQSETLNCDYREASPNYFRALGITLFQGRGILETDTATSNRVVVVNEAFAQKYFAGRSPLGEHVLMEGAPREIVGVVADVKSFLDRPSLPTAFIPAAQASYEASKIWEGWFPRNIVVRSSLAPTALSKTVRQAVQSVDPLVPLGAIRTMNEMMARSLALRNFIMLLLSIFGGLALVLATVGLYGIIAFLVERRTREVGVRIAFGAGSGEVLRLILGEGVKLVLAGMALGILAALALTRLLESMVYAVSPRDPLIFVLVGLLMIGLSLCACYIPARRATRVDPMIALRYE